MLTFWICTHFSGECWVDGGEEGGEEPTPHVSPGVCFAYISLGSWNAILSPRQQVESSRQTQASLLGKTREWGEREGERESEGEEPAGCGSVFPTVWWTGRCSVCLQPEEERERGAWHNRNHNEPGRGVWKLKKKREYKNAKNISRIHEQGWGQGGTATGGLRWL